MAEPVVRVDFTMPAPGGTTYSDSLSFTLAEWQSFTNNKRTAIQNGTHQLCMDKYNAWYQSTHNQPPPVVLTTRQQRRVARREAAARLQAAIAEQTAALAALDAADQVDDE